MCGLDAVCKIEVTLNEGRLAPNLNLYRLHRLSWHCDTKMTHFWFLEIQIL